MTNSVEEVKTQFCNIEVIIDGELRQRNYMNLVRMDNNGLGQGIKAAFAAGSAFEFYIRMIEAYFHQVSMKWKNIWFANINL